MIDTITDVLKKLDAYSFGDLVSAMDFVDYCDNLLLSSDLGEELTTIITNAKETMEAIILMGASDELEALLESSKEALKKLSSPAKEALNKETTDSSEPTTINFTDPITVPIVDNQPISVDDGETLNSFVSESLEHLDNIQDAIINLETTHHYEILDSIFRAMHTIKGISGFMGFTQITTLSHDLESLLDRLRKEELSISTPIVDVLLLGSDTLREMLETLLPYAQDHMEDENSFSINFPIYQMDALIERVQAFTNGVTVADSAPKESAVAAEGPKAIPEKSVNEGLFALANSQVASSHSSAPTSQLNLIANQTKDELLHIKKQLFLLNKNKKDKVALKEVAHSVAKLAEIFENNTNTLIFQLASELKNQLLGKTNVKKIKFSELVSKIKELASAVSNELQNQENQLADESDLLNEADLLNATPISENQIDSANTNPIEKPSEVPASSLPQSNLPQSTLPQSNKEENASINTEHKEQTSIRVDVSKLDKLFNIIGDLITAQDIVLDEIQAEETQELMKSKRHLEKVTRELQELSMQLRMITLNGLFNKMKRVARDLSKKLGKEIDFQIYGQDKEMDRNVIDQISDPLIHIIRNALDHGIESADERERAGKDRIGKVILSAEYEGNGVVISVKDDGAGLNKEKILNKALAQGLIQESQLDSMTEKKIYNLIFHPGFSTSEKISNISGRGVGMDVVKQSISKLRGTISILSKEGVGSEFKIRIPLTLAIIDAITFKVGTLTFATQITDIVEFYRATRSQISETYPGKEILNLRKNLIPIIHLSDIYKTNHNYKSIEEGIIIIASANQKKEAIVVDEIIGTKQLVIKPLPKMFSHLSSLSGWSMLAGGDIALIIDMSQLINSLLD